MFSFPLLAITRKRKRVSAFNSTQFLFFYWPKKTLRFSTLYIIIIIILKYQLVT